VAIRTGPRTTTPLFINQAFRAARSTQALAAAVQEVPATGTAGRAGDPHKASAGCVHLNLTDAKTFYNFLRIGDRVQVTDELDHRHSDSHDNGATDHHEEHQENDEHQGK
jgi:hypothetical protein